mgnify:CR=1 FL=1
MDALPDDPLEQRRRQGVKLPDQTLEAVGQHSAGTIDAAELHDIECAACPSAGSCGGQFTANTMACVSEVMGLALPGSAGLCAMWANNETGVIQPVTEAATLAKSAGIPFHSDAIQAVGKTPISLQQENIDFMSISGRGNCHYFQTYNGEKGSGWNVYQKKDNARTFRRFISKNRIVLISLMVSKFHVGIIQISQITFFLERQQNCEIFFLSRQTSEIIC